MRDVQKGNKIIVFFFLLYSLNFQSKEQRLSFSKVKQISRTDVIYHFQHHFSKASYSLWKPLILNKKKNKKLILALCI